MKTLVGLRIASACIACSASLAGAPVHADDDRAPAAPQVSLVPRCAASVVLVHCSVADAVLDYAAPAGIRHRGFDPNRVIVYAPWYQRITPGQALADALATSIQIVAGGPPGFWVGSEPGPSGSVRDDRDNFGTRNECLLALIDCPNQPGRPQTQRNGG
jgi:hypothetical protein